MAVSQRIVSITAPVREFKREEKLRIWVRTEAYGSGESRLLLSVFDDLLGGNLWTLETDKPLPPGDYIWDVTFPPLYDYYPQPIPGILRWRIGVGYMTDGTGVVTDERLSRIPRVVDRICGPGLYGGEFCVGVSDPYPQPGEEIAFTGHYRCSDPVQVRDYLLCTSEGTAVPGCRDASYQVVEPCQVPGHRIRDPFWPWECHEDGFKMFMDAPLWEGGYSYNVRFLGDDIAESPPVGIWVTTEPSCEDYTTQAECASAGCYWYNGVCHSEPEPPPPPWWREHLGEIMVASFVGTGVLGAVLIVGR